MKVYTTGQVAKFIGVAPRTVCKFFDEGKLPGFRIPGSQDRRFTHEALLKFMIESGMPTGHLEQNISYRVLAIGCTDEFAGSLASRLSPPETPSKSTVGFVIKRCGSVFEAGVGTAEFDPDCVIVDLAVGRIDTFTVMNSIKSHRVRKVVVAGDGEDVPGLSPKVRVATRDNVPFVVGLVTKSAKRKWGGLPDR